MSLQLKHSMKTMSLSCALTAGKLNVESQSFRCQQHGLIGGVGPYVGPIKIAELPS